MEAIEGDLVWSLHINRGHLFALQALLKARHRRLLHPSPDERPLLLKAGVERGL